MTYINLKSMKFKTLELMRDDLLESLGREMIYHQTLLNENCNEKKISEQKIRINKLAEQIKYINSELYN